MDQGVLNNMKCVNRKELLSMMIEEEREECVTDLLKAINFKDVIHMVTDAWNHVTEAL